MDRAAARGDREQKAWLHTSAIGSFAYMAPERFEDRPTTPAVDTYSLAGVLYEALTGQPPLKASSMEQVIAAHLSSPPPQPSVVNPRVPAAFDDVIARGMAKDPDDRYGSPGALGRAAQRALGSTPSTGPSTGPTAVTQAAPVNPAAFTPGNSGPTLPAWQVAQQHSPSSQQPSTSQARPWLVPAVIIAAAALILGGIGVVIGLLARQNTAPPTGAAPSSGYTVPTPTPSYQPEAPPSPPTQLGPTVEPSIAGPPGTDAPGLDRIPSCSL
jgi:serine/threonine kinase PknH